MIACESVWSIVMSGSFLFRSFGERLPGIVVDGFLREDGRGTATRRGQRSALVRQSTLHAFHPRLDLATGSVVHPPSSSGASCSFLSAWTIRTGIGLWLRT